MVASRTRSARRRKKAVADACRLGLQLMSERAIQALNEFAAFANSPVFPGRRPRAPRYASQIGTFALYVYLNARPRDFILPQQPEPRRTRRKKRGGRKHQGAGPGSPGASSAAIRAARSRRELSADAVGGDCK